MIRIVWQTVRRITNEILGVKGLTLTETHYTMLEKNKHQKQEKMNWE